MLGRILDETRSRLRELRPTAAALQDRVDQALPPTGFAESLRQSKNVSVIAEIKRRSPSKGGINEGLDPRLYAQAYSEGGATAISVLTEPDHFGGSLSDLESVAAAVKLPVLRKDFHIDSLQLLEARAYGASAVLLIARAIPPSALLELAAFAQDIGLDVLVEVRDENELETALLTRDTVIGVNNRNLETLEIDATTGERMIPQIPPERTAIWESGVKSVVDVERAAAIGADAVLVGSSLSGSQDPGGMLAALTSVKRVSRGRRS